MKVLRRSLNKDRISHPTTSPKLPGNGPSTSPYPTQPFASLSLASHPARLAKQAPSRVIRALSSYRARRVTELSFEAGDFFHVEGERDGTPEGGVAGSVGNEGWFEASNPATGARGLVPKALFQVLGRSTRDTPSQPPTPLGLPGQPAPPAANGYPFPKTQQSGAKSPNGLTVPIPSPALSAGPRSPGVTGAPSKSAGGSKSQPLYGIVQYDFTAERNDELEAKKGEPIIVIAQSNHEWFVAKPIGRLGGPGLIPVAFVEIQDVTTGKAMPSDKVEELIRSAVVPRVEDWKKATAAYKGNSIPLGRFDFGAPASGAQAPPTTAAQSPPAVSQPSPGLATGAKPMPSPAQPYPPASQPQRQSSTNVLASHSRQQSAGGRQVTSAYEASGLRNGPSAGGRTSQALSTDYPPQHMSQSTPAPVQDPSPTGSNFPGSGNAASPPADEEENYATIDELRDRYGVVVHASVESFHFEQGHYWFHLRAHFARPMPGNPSKEDVTVLVLYRLYQDFYDFQIALMDAFPVEAGRVDQDNKPLSPEEGAKRRILPMMPGPAEHVDELVCAQRVHDLGFYLGELSQLPFYIRECELVYEFLGPREGDVELEGNPNMPQSAASAEGEIVEYLDKMSPRDGLDARPPQSGSSRDSRGSQQPPTGKGHASAGSVSSQGYGRSEPRLQAEPNRTSPPGPSSSTSERTSGLPSSTHSSSSSPPAKSAALAAAQQQGFLRIKIYQHRTDDLIAIRVPTNVTHAQLLDRVRERIGPAINHMRFRDESGRGFSSGGTPPIQASGVGRLVALDNDDDLQRWLEAGQRMVLYAD